MGSQRFSRLLLCRTSAAGLLALAVFLVGGSMPAAAQLNTFLAGPGAIGPSTYVGTIDTPASGSTIAAGAGSQTLVSGWACDTTAQGWAGFDQVQAYNGVMGSGGTRLASGSTGEARPDVAANTGNPNCAASGFSVSVPGNTLVAGGSLALYVYLHTPGNGWWALNATLTVGAPPAQSLSAPAPGPAGSPSGPAVPAYARPNLRATIVYPTPNQTLNADTSYTMAGFAYDVNGALITNVEIYLDNYPGQVGSTPVDLGPASLGNSAGFKVPAGYPGTSGFSFVLDPQAYPPAVNPTSGRTYASTNWPGGGHVIYAFVSGQNAIHLLVSVPVQVY